MCELDIDCVFRYSDQAGVDICDSCAGKVSSAYENWHGGSSCGNSEAKKKKRIGPALALSVFRRDGFICKACKKTGDLTVDHIIPESLGGLTSEENLQTLCRSCNSIKGTKLEEHKKNEMV